MRPQFHEDFARHNSPRTSSDRQFGFVLGLFLAVIALWPALSRGRPRTDLLIAGGILILIAAVAPFLLRPLNRAWTALGMLLGRIMNPVVMAALYYVVFTPWGLLLRLFGRDPLRLRLDPRATSYWVERQPPGPAPESMTNQF